MRATFHRFLLLCLMLALPLQGYAAATMLSCALSHGAAPVAVEAVPPCHSESQPEAPPARHDCAHCAVCLHASALPIPVLPAPAVMSPAPVYGLAIAVPPASFFPEGPERPPRFVLA